MPKVRTCMTSLIVGPLVRIKQYSTSYTDVSVLFLFRRVPPLSPSVATRPHFEQTCTCSRSVVVTVLTFGPMGSLLPAPCSNNSSRLLGALSLLLKLMRFHGTTATYALLSDIVESLIDSTKRTLMVEFDARCSSVLLLVCVDPFVPWMHTEPCSRLYHNYTCTYYEVQPPNR